MSKTKVIIGKKYNKLTPIKVVGRNHQNLLIYECLCECGKTCYIKSRAITSGHTKSCGCRKLKDNGLSGSITYKSWIMAKSRCYDKNHQQYHNYGGRGITMCERWKKSYLAFLDDMGERPGKDYTLDRIDVNGNYEPNNCRWASHKEQGNNRRNNRIINFCGRSYTATQFVETFDVSRSYLYYGFRKEIPLEEIVIRYRRNHPYSQLNIDFD